MLAFLGSFHGVLSLVREVGISGLVDMAIVSLVIYTFMVVVKRTRRSGLIFTGLLGEAKWHHGMAVFCKPFAAAQLRSFDRSAIDQGRGRLMSA